MNLQFYAAFIRPGLEYGLPLLMDESTALKHIQQCQKRSFCKFLGISINARNDIVEGISNFPAISVCQLMLRNRRAFKLSILWNSPYAEYQALAFVRQVLFGPTLSITADLDISKTPVEFRQEHYIIPVSHSLAERSDGLVTIALLFPDKHRNLRTILLWLLHRWNIFDPPRRCLYCKSNFEEKSSCSGIIRFEFGHWFAKAWNGTLPTVDLSEFDLSPTASIVILGINGEPAIWLLIKSLKETISCGIIISIINKSILLNLYAYDLISDPFAC